MPHWSAHPGGASRRRAFGSWLLAAMVVAWPALLSAQEQRTVTGTVTSAESLAPLVGVQVTAKGTNVGTITDSEGNFSIRVPADATTLVFTSIGYRTTEATIEDQVEVALEQQAIELEGLVVTALGIERERRTVPFAAQTVSGDRLTEVPTTNVVSSLQGQVAGIHVTNSSSPFGSARIVSRGAGSILGENQPLVVVDGIPIDNSAAEVTGFGMGSMAGYNIGNAAADIDANNVESVTVLKGPNAAALYGSRAANGAIEIVTKKGQGAAASGFGLSVTVGSTFETPLMLPAYQNQYGQGFGGEFQYVDGNGGGINDGADESWGPKLDGRLIDQFHGEQQPWVAHPDNVRNFWDTGVLSTLNVAISRTAERSNVRLSVSRADENGMYPNNRNIRTGVALSGGAQLSDKLSVEASLDYINSGRRGMPKQSYDNADPMQSFIWFGRQVDTNLLKQNMYRELSDPMAPQILAGNSWMRKDAPIPYNWNYSYHDNPYWMASEKKTNFDRNRLFGHVSATYQFNDWLSLTGRVGRDWYDDALRANYPVNSVGFRLGRLDDVAETRSQTTADFLLSASRPLTSDVNVTINGGGVLSRNEFDRSNAQVTELVIPGVYTLGNSAGQPVTSIFKERKRVNSLYGSASFGYRDWFTVDVTGRNDWSSTLPEGNNSYFYPSIGAAFIFTDALGMQSDVLSYGKLRVSWTRVGNDTDPYELASVYGSGTPWGGQPTFTVDNDLPNADLKPEQTTAVEVGTDLGFFNNRLILNASVYDKRTKDQILPVSISQASGFNRAWVNSGEVRNRGIELVANVTPIETDNFRWDVVANWAKNDSEVMSLYRGVDRVVIGTYWQGNITADLGQPQGTIVGTKWKRDDQGRILVDDAGLPIRDDAQVVIGNYNPDWFGGIGSTFNYKNMSLSFLFDGQWGGDVYSVTKWFGSYSGVLERSLAGRENDWDDPGYVVPNSVYESTGEPNTTPVLAEEYWHNTFYANEEAVLDATYLKLRDARVAYNLPDSFVRRLGFSSATFALVGHNLFLWTKQDLIDPETAFDTGNRQGVENAQLPTARSIGFTLTVKP